MPSIEEKLAKSLTAESTDLIPYLPYLLQDLWELGSSPNDMIHLISENIDVNETTRVLDLACGKGAVSIHIAEKFGCRVKGIDIMSDFIEVARQKSREYGVQSLCEYLTGDINESVIFEKNHDIVILGAVGDVLGNQLETLVKLSATIKREGYVLLDDGYARSQSEKPYLTKEKWLEVIRQSGFELVADQSVSDAELSSVLDEQMECLARRTSELMDSYPEKAGLFEQYLKSQMSECAELENDILGVTMLLKKVK